MPLERLYLESGVDDLGTEVRGWGDGSSLSISVLSPPVKAASCTADEKHKRPVRASLNPAFCHAPPPSLDGRGRDGTARDGLVRRNYRPLSETCQPQILRGKIPRL